MWQQRSRVQWLKNGDQNTKFFHGTATQRKRKNFIKGLRDGNGVWQEDEEVFSAIITDFYTNLFTSSNPQGLDRVLDGVNTVVTETMNAELMRPFTSEEVGMAIKEMAPLKAPGPDGMPPLFYQTYWTDIGMDVAQAVLSCLNSRSILKSINHTFITLIPKVPNPERISNFRPISLCNVIYKIISKTIANCLKPILNSIISETQSAFIADRLITDNILIAFESLHHMKNSCTGKKGFMAMKLDMSKAYDRVEWVFLEKILLKMGFPGAWVALIMECITTVSYSILVNGEPKGMIVPSRGLRQGDPLSPYLFLFCAEGLNALLRGAAVNGEIQGFSLCRNGPKLTHLFFADDCLIFCRSTLDECNKIQELLDYYENASGQVINKEKTTLCFSRNTDEITQEAIKVALDVPAIRHYEKYLGLPSFIGRNRTACFTQIKERIWGRMQGWKEKLLSQAGREIMIKAVVQSIPVYSMSVFKLPVSLCKDIEAMVRKFWWGNGDAKKIHWVKWSSLYSPKSIGRMGFRDFQKFNNALLAKQVWRLIHNRDSLLFKVFSAKYFPHGNIMEAEVHPKCSYAWRSILQARGVIEQGAIWRVGDGNLIDVWQHRWLPDPNHSKIISPRTDSSVHRVCDLFFPDTRVWDPGRLESCLIPWEAELVRRIQVCEDGAEDTLIWPLTSDGDYSVRSAYRMLVSADSILQPSSSSSGNPGLVWKKIWKMRVPNKIRHFIWRAAKDSLPTKQNLKARHIPIDEVCDGCGEHTESTVHCLWLCDQVRSVWMSLQEFRSLVHKKFRTFYELLEEVLSTESNRKVALFVTVAWCLWQRRNRVRERQPSWQLHELGDHAHRMVDEFWNVNSKEHGASIPRSVVRWSPPPEDRFKINFDAAYFEDSGSAGIGVVCRDHSGQAIAALCQNLGKVQSAEMAEALAARRAVIFAREMSLFDIIVEGDCLAVIQALLRGGPCPLLFGHIIDETKRLGGVLRRCMFQHVRRNGNRLAHCLAKKAVLSAGFEVWVEDLPEDVDVVFQSDLP